MQKIAGLEQGRLGALVLGCFALTLLAARAAQACTYPATPAALKGYPDEGALGVPTDVRLIYEVAGVANTELLAAVYPDRVVDDSTPEHEVSPLELVDEAGAVTPLELTDGGGSWLFESVPRAALLPRTRYVLRTTEPLSDGELRLSFTTGDGPLTTLPEPPSVEIEHYLSESIGDSCSPQPHGTCLRFAEPAAGFYIRAQLFHQAEGPFGGVYLARRPWFFDISGIEGPPDLCVEFRTRAPNGALSDPIDRCRADGPLYEVAGPSNIACTAGGITRKGQLLSAAPEDVGSAARSQSSSCALASLPHSRSAALAVLPLLAALLRRRARRASVRG